MRACVCFRVCIYLSVSICLPTCLSICMQVFFYAYLYGCTPICKDNFFVFADRETETSRNWQFTSILYVCACMRDVCEQMYTREKPKKKHEGETQRKISTLSSTHVTQPRLNIRASARKEREEERERDLGILCIKHKAKFFEFFPAPWQQLAWPVFHLWWQVCRVWEYTVMIRYGVATTSRLLKIIGLFCKRAL